MENVIEVKGHLQHHIWNESKQIIKLKLTPLVCNKNNKWVSHYRRWVLQIKLFAVSFREQNKILKQADMFCVKQLYLAANRKQQEGFSWKRRYLWQNAEHLWLSVQKRGEIETKSMVQQHNTRPLCVNV